MIFIKLLYNNCCWYLKTLVIIFLGVSVLNCEDVSLISSKSKSMLNQSSKILVLMYINADNDKESELLQVVNSLESVPISDRHEITVVLLIDRAASGTTEDDDWTDARGYELGFDNIVNTSLVSKRVEIEELGIDRTNTQELNMGSARSLEQFISFGKRKYATQETTIVLILIGAYSKWDNVGVDESETVPDPLTISEVANGISSAGAVDFIVLDHIPMSIELWYEIGNNAKYIVASPNLIPKSPGWDYFTLLKGLGSASIKSTSILKEEAIQHSIMTLAPQGALRRSQLTIVKGESADELKGHIDTIGTELTSYVTTQAKQTEVIGILNGLTAELINPGAYFIDIEEMSKALNSHTWADTAPVVSASYTGIKNISDDITKVMKVGNRTGAMGVLIYLKELQDAGKGDTVTDQYKKHNAASSLQFVKQSVGWSADTVKKTGLLYKLWLDNSLP